MNPTRPLIAWLATALVALICDPAYAGPDPVPAVPDSATMAGLREAVARAPILVVTSHRGVHDLRRARMDSTGVWSASWEDAADARPALITTTDAARPAVKPIAWGEIERLQTQHPHKLRGAVAGAVLGLAVSVLVLGSSGGMTTDAEAGAAVVLGPMVLGALVGTFVGSAVGTKTIYRAQETH